MIRRVFWVCMAAKLGVAPTRVLAQRTLVTIARVNLHSGPRRSSPVQRVPPRDTRRAWDGTLADGEGMLRVVPGVGFFDFGHSTGHPPNAFELHPVLSIRFGARPMAHAQGAIARPLGGGIE